MFDGDGSRADEPGRPHDAGAVPAANLVHVVFDNESLLSVGGFPTATSTGSDLAAIATAAGIPRTATVRTLDAFTAAFDEALAAGDLTTIVAKVDAVGPAAYVTDLSLLENRFQFQRYLRVSPEQNLESQSRCPPSSAQLVAELERRPRRVVDLTQPLGPGHAGIGLAAASSRHRPACTIEVISRYDDKGPAWYWNTIRWASTRARTSTRPCTGSQARTCRTTRATRFPRASFVGPACVIDVTREVGRRTRTSC